MTVMKAKPPPTLRQALRQPETVAARLSVAERILLFCITTHTDWQKPGVTGATVTAMAVRGLIERDAAARLSLTDQGREVLAALLLGRVPSRKVLPSSPQRAHQALASGDGAYRFGGYSERSSNSGIGQLLGCHRTDRW
jgi:hypothetical protein